MAVFGNSVNLYVVNLQNPKSVRSLKLDKPFIDFDIFERDVIVLQEGNISVITTGFNDSTNLSIKDHGLSLKAMTLVR
jgi:hypothetical protein